LVRDARNLLGGARSGTTHRLPIESHTSHRRFNGFCRISPARRNPHDIKPLGGTVSRAVLLIIVVVLVSLAPPTSATDDADNDNDSWTNSEESECGSDPDDSNSIPNDYDGDGRCDIIDPDIDGDGVCEGSFDVGTPPLGILQATGAADVANASELNAQGTIIAVQRDSVSHIYAEENLVEATLHAYYATDIQVIIDVINRGDADYAIVFVSEGITSGAFCWNCGEWIYVDPYPICAAGPDVFPYDATENSDHDGDGIGDYSDTDADGDGWLNWEEAWCGTDPMDAFSVPVDNDNDGTCDPMDDDDDGDGYLDGVEIECLSSPTEVTDIPVDSDLDGICDPIDADVDGDGYDNADEAFPENPDEWADFDLDGIGDNADTDDDNDLVLDGDDAFPYDPYETIDTDGDGVGDNADDDDDDDGWPDVMDTRPLDSTIQSEWDLIWRYVLWGVATILIIALIRSSGNSS